MFFNSIDTSRLERLFPDIIEGIDFHEWHEVFPSVIGYEPFIPQNLKEAEQHEDSFRCDDKIIAMEMVKYPEFHVQMIDIIHQIMDINKNSGMWDLCTDEEYPGINFVHALALHDIKHVELYSDFLLTIKPKHNVLYLEYDIVRLIKKWNWGPETYYLLFCYWFLNHKEKFVVLTYLSEVDCSLKLKLQKVPEQEIFIQALILFLSQSGYFEKNIQEKHAYLFEELVTEFIFPEEKDKQEIIKNRYSEIVKRLQNGEPLEAQNENPEEEIAVLGPENNDSTDITQPSWSWDDEDIPEI